MASQRKSIQQRADRSREYHLTDDRYDREGARNQTPIHAGYCAVCFLTFGSQEQRAVWRGKVTHLRCVGRLREGEAA